MMSAVNSISSDTPVFSHSKDAFEELEKEMAKVPIESQLNLFNMTHLLLRMSTIFDAGFFHGESCTISSPSLRPVFW